VIPHRASHARITPRLAAGRGWVGTVRPGLSGSYIRPARSSCTMYSKGSSPAAAAASRISAGRHASNLSYAGSNAAALAIQEDVDVMPINTEPFCQGHRCRRRHRRRPAARGPDPPSNGLVGAGGETARCLARQL
jgi:hypothetical protein